MRLISTEPKALEAGVIEIFGADGVAAAGKANVSVGLSGSFDGIESAGSLCSYCLPGQM